MKYEIKTHVDDDLKLVIYEKVPHSSDGIVQYSGTATLPVIVTHPNGQQQQMQHQYQFPIEADNIDDAFYRFEGAKAVAEMDEKKKIAEQQRQATIAMAAQRSKILMAKR